MHVHVCPILNLLQRGRIGTKYGEGTQGKDLREF
jgi:hypothetical protein